MAKHFKSFGNDGTSTSWADEDDDIDVPLPIASLKLPDVAEKDQPEEEAPARRDFDHRDDVNHRGLRNDRRNDDRRSGNDDRRNDDRRGGYDDRRRDRDYADRRGGGGVSDRPKTPVPDHPPFKLYVGNVRFHLVEDDLADFFGDHDAIANVVIPFDHVLNRPKGFAYIEFKTREALERALTFDGQEIDGRPVRLDVASERAPRQDRSSNFFEKREGRSRGPERERPAPKERPHISLLPRGTSATDLSDGSKKPSIFGEAKPRDESAYLERQKAREQERKQAKELERKQAKEQAARRKTADSDDRPKDGEGEKKPAASSLRKNSHDDGHGFRAGSRGATRGGRGERPGRGESRGRGGEHGGRGAGEHGGRGAGEHGGRGGEHGGRGSRDAASSAKKEQRKEPKKEPKREPKKELEGKKEPEAVAAAPAPASSRKSEPRAKRTEPAKVKISAPAPAKVVNAFAALGADDSDSDSD